MAYKSELKFRGTVPYCGPLPPSGQGVPEQVSDGIVFAFARRI